MGKESERSKGAPKRSLRLVGFLGLGGRRADGSTGYETTSYRWHGEEHATEYLAEALCRFFRPGEVVLLATARARAAHAETLRDRLQPFGVEPDLREIPEGATEPELWRQFEVLTDSVAIADRDLVLDITYGYRSQSFFAAAALAFERALAEDPGEVRVVYGAFDRDRSSVTLVWDLTPFVDLIDWAHSLLLFLRTGQAGGVTAAVGRAGSGLLREWAAAGRGGARPGEIRDLAEALRRFGNDLTTLRSLDLVGARGGEGSAAALLARLSDYRSEIATRLPPLARVLDRLAREVAPLHGPDPLRSEGGARALAALARHYLETGRLLEAAIVARESWLTRLTSEGEEGPRAFRIKVRLEAERRFLRDHPEVAKRVGSLRNDLAHGGFRDSPWRPDKLIQDVREVVDELERELLHVKPALLHAEAPAEGVFLNLSNHPSAPGAETGGSGWSEEQLEAARTLAPRIVDLQFPRVPPSAGLEELERLAGEILRQVPRETAVALVTGEHTLTTLLVAALQERGVRCVSATTERQVTDLGGGKKETTFRFVRFRDYPALIRAEGAE